MSMHKAVLIETVLAFVCLSAHGQEASTPPKYSLKEGQPATGSLIKRATVEQSDVPFDAAYADLTPEQRAIVRAQYEAMADGDEPPYPVNGTKAIYQALAKGQQLLSLRGNLSMYVEVDSKGNAVSVGVFESPDERMTQYMAAVLMKEKYKPAVCKGAPCRMQFPIRVRLGLR